jgi:hypothetical protein
MMTIGITMVAIVIVAGVAWQGHGTLVLTAV